MAIINIAILEYSLVICLFTCSPDLTWRDVQYLIAYTSNPDILTGDDWVANAAGLNVSHHFGFGAIDAEAMVTRARHWINVPEQHKLEVPFTSQTRLFLLLKLQHQFNLLTSSQQTCLLLRFYADCSP